MKWEVSLASILLLLLAICDARRSRHHRVHGNDVTHDVTNIGQANDKAVTAVGGTTTPNGGIVTAGDLANMLDFNPAPSQKIDGVNTQATTSPSLADMSAAFDPADTNDSSPVGMDLEVDMTGMLPPARTDSFPRTPATPAGGFDSGANGNGSKDGGILYQFVDLGPYMNHRRYTVRFLLAMFGYLMSGLCAIVAISCLARRLRMRGKLGGLPHYQMLSQRDLEFPLGGGGI